MTELISDYWKFTGTSICNEPKQGQMNFIIPNSQDNNILFFMGSIEYVSWSSFAFKGVGDLNVEGDQKYSGQIQIDENMSQISIQKSLQEQTILHLENFKIINITQEYELVNADDQQYNQFSYISKWKFFGKRVDNNPSEGTLIFNTEDKYYKQLTFNGKILKKTPDSYQFEGNGNLELRQGLSFTGLIKIDETMDRIECKIGKVRKIFSLTKDGISLLVLETTEQQIEHCRQKLKNVSSKSYLQFVSGFRAQKSSLKNLKLFKVVAANIKPLNLNEQEMLALESSSKMIRCNMWQFSGEQIDGKPSNGVITFAESAFFNPEKFVSFTGQVYSIYKSGIAFRGFGQLVQRKENGIITLEGEIENGKLISQGRIIHENGVVQTGDFSKQAGEFTFTEPNGNHKVAFVNQDAQKTLQVQFQGKIFKQKDYNLQTEIKFINEDLYIGEIKNDKPHGLGEMHLKNKGTVKGIFQYGLLFGPATETCTEYTQEALYEGGVVIRKTKRQEGNVKYKYVSGNEKGGYQVQVTSPDFMYVGGMNKDQEYDGEGTLTSLDQNEQMELKAVWSRGNVTKKISERIGSKLIVYESGNEQSGYKATVTNGSEKYSGEFKDAKYHGKGQLTRDGVLYDGEFEEGEMNGEVAVVEGPEKFAVYTYERGEQKEKVATFENKTYTRYSGSEALYTYVGQMKNYKPNGYGKATYANEDEEDGNWKDGKFCHLTNLLSSKMSTSNIASQFNLLKKDLGQIQNVSNIVQKKQDHPSILTSNQTVDFTDLYKSSEISQTNSNTVATKQDEVSESENANYMSAELRYNASYQKLSQQNNLNSKQLNRISSKLQQSSVAINKNDDELSQQSALIEESNDGLTIPVLNYKNYDGMVMINKNDIFMNAEVKNGVLQRVFEVKTRTHHYIFESGDENGLYIGTLLTDNSKTEGSFTPAGLRHDKCEITFNDESKLTAQFNEGKLVKRIRLQSEDRQIDYLTGDEKTGYTGTIHTPQFKYSGGIYQDVEDGNGEVTYISGEVLQAQYIRGKLQGQCTIIYPNGTEKVRLYNNGDFIKVVKDNTADINETTKVLDFPIGNSLYTGFIDSNSKPHGHGIKKNQQSSQSGRYIHGLLDGEIESIKPGFRKLEYYQKGIMLKYLEIEIDNYVKIQFSNGIKSQLEGNCAYTEGSIYSGELSNNFDRHGRGTMTYLNGDRACGQWSNGLFNGKIERTTKHHFTYKDTYSNNTLIQHLIHNRNSTTITFKYTDEGLKAHITFPNGTYDGDVSENGLPNGFGIIKMNSGDYLQGPFVNGFLCGDYVNYKIKGFVYKGSYYRGESGNGEYRGDKKARWVQQELIWKTQKWVQQEENIKIKYDQ
ncbi:Conserved_hypothetical protein [Hexamita inflata]|uniref:MORN repeat protein n=1 Tax=Hexamita inflata TaxID=28002 RepID=A0AA86R0X4_9EUKA|nr:Conserved hypothetical protein [Hexamita inflata]